MCGIAGAVTSTSARDQLAATADRMMETLAHRGPDDSGRWIDPERGVALCHRRLAVVGLGSAGAQPMVSQSGRWVITYNGEVYNFQALRAELEQRGSVFRGSSDTEVLVEAVDRLGLISTLRRVDGMFAFAAWDRETSSLALVRDRFGEKPLYFGRFGGTFLFGSELKALRTHPAFDDEPDLAAVAAYFAYGYMPGRGSIYAQVQRVQPGSIVEIDRDRRISETRWWDPSIEAHRSAGNPFAGRLDDAVDEVSEALRRSVAARMIADVPVGVLLSGGIDSAAVTLLAAEQSDRPLETFSVGFEHPDYDESAQARSIANHVGSVHRTIEVSAMDVSAILPRLPGVWDEPFADSSQIPTLMVSELARRSVTVALTGDGGDELFGGYDRYRYVGIVQRFGSLLGLVPPSVMKRAAGMAGSLAASFHLERQARRFEKIGRATGLTEPRDVYRSLVQLSDRYDGKSDRIDPLADWGSWPGRVVEQAMGTDTVSYLPDDILVKVDRATMAHSLEGRMPFLTEELFQLAWSLPPEMRWAADGGKAVVRGLVGRHLPSTHASGPKRGFGVPLADWLRTELREWSEDLLLSSNIRRAGFADTARLGRLWSSHLDGADHTSELWSHLMFEAWRRHHHPQWQI